jgi:hypothetical protein
MVFRVLLLRFGRPVRRSILARGAAGRVSSRPATHLSWSQALKPSPRDAEALSAFSKQHEGTKMDHCIGEEESSVKPKRYTAADGNIILVVEKREGGTYVLVDFVLMK